MFLEYYGFLSEQSIYHYIKVFDAKILLHYTLKKGCVILPTTLKRCNYYINLDNLRKYYAREMRKQQEDKVHMNELQKRKKHGYIL